MHRSFIFPYLLICKFRNIRKLFLGFCMHCSLRYEYLSFCIISIENKRNGCSKYRELFIGKCVVSLCFHDKFRLWWIKTIPECWQCVDIWRKGICKRWSLTKFVEDDILAGRFRIHRWCCMIDSEFKFPFGHMSSQCQHTNKLVSIEV